MPIACFTHILSCPADNSVSMIASENVVFDPKTVEKGSEVTFYYGGKQFDGTVIDFGDEDDEANLKKKLAEIKKEIRKEKKQVQRAASFKGGVRAAAKKGRKFLSEYAESVKRPSGKTVSKAKTSDDEDASSNDGSAETTDDEDKDTELSKDQDSGSSADDDDDSSEDSSLSEGTGREKAEQKKALVKARASDVSLLHQGGKPQRNSEYESNAEIPEIVQVLVKEGQKSHALDKIPQGDEKSEQQVEFPEPKKTESPSVTPDLKRSASIKEITPDPVKKDLETEERAESSDRGSLNKPKKRKKNKERDAEIEERKFSKKNPKTRKRKTIKKVRKEDSETERVESSDEEISKTKKVKKQSKKTEKGQSSEEEKTMPQKRKNITKIKEEADSEAGESSEQEKSMAKKRIKTSTENQDGTDTEEIESSENELKNKERKRSKKKKTRKEEPENEDRNSYQDSKSKISMRSSSREEKKRRRDDETGLKRPSKKNNSSDEENHPSVKKHKTKKTSDDDEKGDSGNESEEEPPKERKPPQEVEVYKGQMFRSSLRDCKVNSEEIPGVVISSEQLTKAKEKTSGTELARVLFKAVFTQKALLSCSLGGHNAYGTGSREKPRPSLDQNATAAIFQYVIKRQKAKAWKPAPPLSVIKQSVRSMLAETRCRAKKLESKKKKKEEA